VRSKRIQSGQLSTAQCKDSSCGCDNPNPNLTLYQSRQRELIRVLAGFHTLLIHALNVCPYLLIRLYYIIKLNKNKNKKNINLEGFSGS